MYVCVFVCVCVCVCACSKNLYEKFFLQNQEFKQVINSPPTDKKNPRFKRQAIDESRPCLLYEDMADKNFDRINVNTTLYGINCQM